MYLLVKYIHIASVVISVTGFLRRGILMLRSSPLLAARWIRVLPHVNDTILLTAALLCVAAGCIVLANVTGVLALAAYGVYGVGQGLMTVVGSASWANFFGPAHLVMGASVDYLGGFEPSLWLFTAVATFVAAIGAIAGGGEGAATATIAE